jgi:transposase
MRKCIMVGADVHDRTLVLKAALGRGRPEDLVLSNDADGRRRLVAEFRRRARRAGDARVVVAYEASGAGFGLHDELTDAGFECHVLAPTRIRRSVKHRRSRNDRRDTGVILETLRAHVLAGNDLPSVWIPDRRTRDDRELVRSRLDAAEKLAAIKTQTRCLLRRNGIRRPKHVGKGWTAGYRDWLSRLARLEGPDLGLGGRLALETYLRQMEAIEKEIALLDESVAELADSDRYREPVRALCSEFKGVAVLTAMVFLTEMGDLRRFSNRREVGSYMGLTPSSDESGEAADRKGHITHQGPARVRKVLCQASWSRIRTDEHDREVYQRILEKNPRRKMIGVVAIMRRLGTRMFHVALEAQIRAKCFDGEPAPRAASG